MQGNHQGALRGFTTLAGRRGAISNAAFFLIAVLMLATAALLRPMCTSQATADEPRAATTAEEEKMASEYKRASVFLSHCEYEQAKVILEHLVKESERLYGAEHPKTLWQRHELGAAYLKARDFSKAEAQFREVWKLRTKVLGPKHADTLLSHFQLALSLCSQHKHPQAEAEYRLVLADEERILGPDHVLTLQTDFRLAQCLEMQGRVADARVFAFRAYEGAKTRFGETSVEFITYRMLWRQLQE